jgi:hypothetical protein
VLTFVLLYNNDERHRDRHLTFGCHVAVGDVAPAFRIRAESEGEGGVYSPGLGDMPHHRGCVTSIQPALVHLVTGTYDLVLLHLLPHFPAIVVGRRCGTSGAYR